MIDLEPIGIVHSPLETTEEAPSQAVKADIRGRIEIDASYEKALQGMRVGDEIQIVWYADRADRSLLVLDKVPGRGVFNSRSPARPNPIGITTGTITAIEGTTIEVRGIDMLDGTPVLDIKVPLERDIQNPPSRGAPNNDK